MGGGEGGDGTAGIWRAIAESGETLWVLVVQDEMDVQPGGRLGIDARRNFSNSIDRLRRYSSPMTVPVLTSSAANNEVVPWRR